MDDNDLTTSTNLQPKQPPIDDSGLIDLAQKRLQQIEERHKKFKKASKIFKIFFVLTILAIIGGLYFRKQENLAPQPYVTPTPTVQEKPIDYETDLSSWITYRNDNVKVFIRHPMNSAVIESDKPATRIDVIHQRDSTYPTSLNEDELNQGYIFRVTPLNVGIRTIDEITKLKVESMKVKCPSTSVFSEATQKLIDGVDARMFEVSNCNSDYIIWYVPRFNIYYEIMQIYKGDFGYKQKYRAVLEEMMRSFKFYPEESNEPVGYYKPYTNTEFKFTLIHPSLDTKCCSAPEPPLQGVQRIVTLGDHTNFKDERNQDSVGIFIQRFASGQDFAAKIESQKNLLREDYKVVTGRDPETQEREVKIGQYRGVMLKGYSWKGNELIYSDIPTENGVDTYVFSIMHYSGEKFEQQALKMLETFEKTK